jgi:hypothetical protein
MINMTTFQDRFKPAFDAEVKRRAEAGEPKLTKTMVWKAAKASSGAFTQWYDGTTGAKLDTCFLIAPILRVDPHWLFDESNQKKQPKTPSTVPFKSDRDRQIDDLLTVAATLSDKGLVLLTGSAMEIAKNHPDEAKQTPKSTG